MTPRKAWRKPVFERGAQKKGESKKDICRKRPGPPKRRFGR